MGGGVGAAYLLPTVSSTSAQGSAPRLPSMPVKRSTNGKRKRKSTIPALHLKNTDDDRKLKRPTQTSSTLSLPRLLSTSVVEGESDVDKSNGSWPLDDSSLRTPSMTSAATVSRNRSKARPVHGGVTNDVVQTEVNPNSNGASDARPEENGRQFPARRKEKIQDWRDVKSKMRRRLFQPLNVALADVKEGPILRRLTPEETLRRRAMPAIELPPDYVGPVLPGERVAGKTLPDIPGAGGGGRPYHRQSSVGEASEVVDSKTAIRNFRRNCLKREPLETIRENKCAEHELETGFWQFFDQHFKI